MAIPFVKELDFAYGQAAELSPRVRRIVARNPSAFTFHGTGTYIVGRGKDVAVIDPGPDDEAHVRALLDALDGETVTHILITHTHRDHSPAAALLKRITGAPTYGFGPHPVPKGGLAVEEGGDHDFTPDHVLSDGDTVSGAGWTLTALHTPGHISNHLCFALKEEQALFSGDHVMGWSTTVISPPDGSMTEYYASLRRLLPREERRFYPTHGAPVDEGTTGVQPQNFVQALLQHREAREAQIVDCLKRNGPQSIPQMVAAMYADVPVYLHPAAARSVLAHLIHMAAEGRVKADGQVSETAVYHLP
ncbi:MBL fold metallo-hydrolase [uncultured Ferrovibrio sp.]|jgi:Zn-dependent hydrolases, including glyoxylases|uniref:MBL fold metallo-hydrolase n=1 Tax=uncultured Ferrovibrio sp. TaxID=1576913 RepID=UPI0026289030|nr:MBL fold metallo-hydrolase [uncultured Ferrovibrio sp.]